MRALAGSVLLFFACPAFAAEPPGADEAAMRYGHSARQLIGAEARGRGGERLGAVADLLIGPAGRVSGLLVGTPPVAVIWQQLAIAPEGTHVMVLPGTPGRDPDLVPKSEARASALLGDAVTLENGERYGSVRDLVISRTGAVAAVVVERAGAGPNALRALTWRGARLDPAQDTHALPYDGAQLARLRPFDYGSLGILTSDSPRIPRSSARP